MIQFVFFFLIKVQICKKKKPFSRTIFERIFFFTTVRRQRNLSEGHLQKPDTYKVFFFLYIIYLHVLKKD